MRLYLARHGRTNYNDLGLCNADPAVDVHLTSAGVSQANALAEKLKSVPLECIYVSELKRTQQTAERVNKFHGVAVEIDARLNDGRSGFEGKHFTEYGQALNAADNRWTARFNDGESIEDIKKRVADFIDELRTQSCDAILIVTSLWIIQAVMAVAQGLTNEEAWSIESPQGDCIELNI